MAASAALSAQCPDGTPPPCAGARVAATAPPRSVAVLYLANRSADSSDAYLAEGLTEGIITRLSRDPRLTVKSTSAVARLKGLTPPPDSAGRVLRVANLVSGSVARSGHRLRVSVELVRASSGTTLWAGQYDGADADLFDIQTAIADSVSMGIAGRLLPGMPRAPPRAPTNPAAYDEFLQGNYHLARRTPEDTREAIRRYEAALAHDPGFADAEARIALAYSIALDWGWGAFDPASSIRAGLSASARALELDSMLADAWTARGYILRFANARSYAGVREAFRHAVRLAPRDDEALLQFGWALENLGRTDSAIQMIRRAVTLDPERSVSRFTLAMVLSIARRPAEALATIDTGLTMDATAPALHGIRAWLRLSLGDLAGARADGEAEHSDSRMGRAALASIACARGDTAAAAAIRRPLTADYPPSPAKLSAGAVYVAMAFGGCGDAAGALDLVERIEPQGLQVWNMLQFPAFDAVRHDPRFARFAAELAPTGIGQR